MSYTSVANAGNKCLDLSWLTRKKKGGGKECPKSIINHDSMKFYRILCLRWNFITVFHIYIYIYTYHILFIYIHTCIHTYIHIHNIARISYIHTQTYIVLPG